VKAAKLSHQQQQKAADLLQQVQVIVASSQDAIISTNMDGMITSWNEGARRMFGYDAAEVIGKSGSRLWPPEMWSKVPALLKKIAAKERVNDYDIAAVRKDGTKFDMSISISPITRADGTVIGASVVERDITDRMKSESRIREADALKSKFIQIVAHQLRTPLSAIRWSLESFLEENLGPLLPGQKEFIRMTHDEAVVVIDRVGDLLTAMDIEIRRASATVLLVKALGGDWKNPPPSQPPGA